MKIGRLMLRLVIGGLFIGHGTQKLFGWFGGYGLDATGEAFEQTGLRPGRANAIAAGAAEAGGGALLAAGLATPLAAATLTSVMLTAIKRVHLEGTLDLGRRLRVQPRDDRGRARASSTRGRGALAGRRPRAEHTGRPGRSRRSPAAFGCLRGRRARGREVEPEIAEPSPAESDGAVAARRRRRRRRPRRPEIVGPRRPARPGRRLRASAAPRHVRRSIAPWRKKPARIRSTGTAASNAGSAGARGRRQEPPSAPTAGQAWLAGRPAPDGRGMPEQHGAAPRPTARGAFCGSYSC